MASPIPSPAAEDSTGLADSSWITRVRDALRDYPAYTIGTWQADGVNGVIGPNAVPLRTDKSPINDGSLLVYDATTATNYTVITTGSPSAGQVLANYDTGELVFGAAPAAADAIQISYQWCKWRDQTILDNLYAGLRAMFPRVGKVQEDNSVNIQVNVWDYTLPSFCQDPRSRIYDVQIRDPNVPTEPYHDIAGGWFRKGLTTLHIPQAQRYSPVARLWIYGWGPYLTLGDLEPQLYHLPVLYALGLMMPKQDTYRLRQDAMVPLTQEGGQAPLLMTQSGDHFMKQFETEMERLARVMGPGYNIRLRSYLENQHR